MINNAGEYRLIYTSEAATMGDRFPLLEQLGELERNPDTATPLPRGVKYQQYKLNLENAEVKVFIPLRETVEFEATLSEHGKYLNRDDLNALLRKHRGIRNRE